ncbi:hypothetical protein [Halochromatium glycolicum]|uniref:hypothetical protein n=1 Tax=Halochromatium glycolicum TaxID=85075 RepID=UPI001A91A6A7|nr:hypothetical protein [Halochromatium glycolicum]
MTQAVEATPDSGLARIRLGSAANIPDLGLPGPQPLPRVQRHSAPIHIQRHH